MSFRPGLLEGRRVALAGGVPAAIGARLQDLGAWVEPMSHEAVLDETAAAAWVSERTPLHGLVLDAGPALGHGDPAGLSAALRLAWVATRAVATAALIPGNEPGKVTLIAPRPDAESHAQAVRAALENLARTLSVEWARYGITAAAVWPGAATTDEDLATLICFLHSRAGEYLTGCRLDLDAVMSPTP